MSTLSQQDISQFREKLAVRGQMIAARQAIVQFGAVFVFSILAFVVLQMWVQ